MRDPSIFSIGSKALGPIRRLLLTAAAPAVDRIVGLKGVAEIYRLIPDGYEGVDMVSFALDHMGVEALYSREELDRVPREGPLVLVSNHPFGAVEGMVLPRLIGEVRPDVKVLANFLLGRIPELRDLFLLVDPFGEGGSVQRNLSALRRTVSWVREGGALVVFPAGEVAHLNLRHRRVTDPPWQSTVGRIIRMARCPAVPIYFSGRNGALFQALGLVHPRLRTAMLPREFLKRRDCRLEIRIGTPVPFERLDRCDSDESLTRYLRNRTYLLAERDAAPPRPSLKSMLRPLQPRRTPERVEDLHPPVDPRVLEAEIDALPSGMLLVESKGLQVYLGTANTVPNVLTEIGRLREFTFRDAGEGTGRALDLDRFDHYYLHLFIWHRDRREIVGAYRIGHCDRMLAREGLKGLYTSSLFRYKPRLFDAMGPALEMGRSFIRPEYQKSYAGLLLLWKGIGRYVCRDPRYGTLFGPVSISADYHSASQRLMVAFLEQNRFAHPWSRWVRPRTPFRPGKPGKERPGLEHLRNLEEVSTYISEIEADASKGVPILLKQYLKLGGRLLGFNVDPAFSNVLDVLILVDLRHTEPKILKRYMGTEEATRFFAHHGREV